MTINRAVCGVLSWLVLPAGVVAWRAAPALPPRLDSYLSNVVKLSAAERKRLTDGAPVTKLLEADASKEVAVFGAIWIAAPIARYIEAVNDIERLESGAGYRITRRISARPVIEDFAAMHLPEDDVKDLRKCRVGSCDIKLDEPAIHRFQSEVNWRAADARGAADALMRRVALEYVTRYLEGGNGGLPVYRDKSRPTVVADEFRAMIGGVQEFQALMPDLRPYLLEYPRVTLPGASSFFYWQETVFGLKPTLRISHLTIREGKDQTVVTSKMLYASHYFWTAIELRTLLPDPSRGTGFWLITSNRSRSDGLSGFTGTFVRRRVRSQVQGATMAGLQLTKQRVEGRR
jgi:hypothetical protein